MTDPKMTVQIHQREFNGTRAFINKDTQEFTYRLPASTPEKPELNASLSTITNPMLCKVPPKLYSIDDLKYSVIKLLMESTSKKKTLENTAFWSTVDQFMECLAPVIHDSTTGKALALQYCPLLKNGQLNLKVVHCTAVQIVDQNQKPITLDLINGPEMWYCKFIIEPHKMMIRKNTYFLSIWVHSVMIKPAFSQKERSHHTKGGKKRTDGSEKDESDISENSNSSNSDEEDTSSSIDSPSLSNHTKGTSSSRAPSASTRDERTNTSSYYSNHSNLSSRTAGSKSTRVTRKSSRSISKSPSERTNRSVTRNNSRGRQKSATKKPLRQQSRERSPESSDDDDSRSQSSSHSKYSSTTKSTLKKSGKSSGNKK
jgi:hypothetical protein